MGLISPCQWLLIQDACMNEVAARMVSREVAGISSTIPLVFLHTAWFDRLVSEGTTTGGRGGLLAVSYPVGTFAYCLYP